MKPRTPSDADVPDSRPGLERELKRGTLDLIVLQLLEGGEAYGFEIVGMLGAATAGRLEITDGTLYPVLYRLEKAGFLATRWETPSRGVPRKYYLLTESGRAERAALALEWRRFADAMAALLGRKGHP
jgi:PadR family transcriptional regulator PadR